MKCGICGQRWVFDPDGVYGHAIEKHGLDFVEALPYFRVVIAETLEETPPQYVRNMAWFLKIVRRLEKIPLEKCCYDGIMKPPDFGIFS